MGVLRLSVVRMPLLGKDVVILRNEWIGTALLFCRDVMTIFTTALKLRLAYTSHYENVPFEVPEGWCWVRVYDISSAIIYGVSESAKSEGKYKLLRITDIQNNKVNWNTVPLTDYPEEKAASYTLRTGDILFARTGATVGKSYLVDNSVPENSIYASYLIRVQVSSIINSNYVKYFFESGFYWNQIADNSVGVGQPNVNGTSLGNLWLPIPPIQEQERIVEKLNSWCTIIDEIKVTQESIRATMSDLRSRILEYAISGKLVPQDYSDESAIELLKRINPMFSPADNRHYRQLPDSWETCQLKDIFDITMGQSPAGDTINGKYGTEFHQGKINFTNKYLAESAQYTTTPSKIAAPESLLLCVRAPVGIVNITKREICIGRGLCSLRPKYDIDSLYWLYMLSTLKDYFEENATGSTFKAISGDIIRNASIPFPPLSEQRRILSKINELFCLLDKITAEL